MTETVLPGQIASKLLGSAALVFAGSWEAGSSFEKRIFCLEILTELCRHC